MKKYFLLIIAGILVFGALITSGIIAKLRENSGAPPYLESDLEPPDDDGYSWVKDWKRPDGPAKVGLQVGHWKSSDLPDELQRLRGNTGSSGGGKWEWEVNKKIAELTAEILSGYGIEVHILPATIPPQFWADVFTAIHADGSEDTSKSGFKLANPRRDFTGNASDLLSYIEKDYQNSTGLDIDPNVTRNMRGYYAFSWWRYEHAVHPMTASVILETGFLTNPVDRLTIVKNPQKSASGLASGIIRYLKSRNLID